MNIYVSHKRRQDFVKALYQPLQNSELSRVHHFIFPHEAANKTGSFDTKSLFQNKGCDLVLAEVSEPATGQGIELAWASDFGIPILCMYKKGSDISGSLKLLTDQFFEYSDSGDMIKKIEEDLKNLEN